MFVNKSCVTLLTKRKVCHSQPLNSLVIMKNVFAEEYPEEDSSMLSTEMNKLTKDIFRELIFERNLR